MFYLHITETVSYMEQICFQETNILIFWQREFSFNPLSTHTAPSPKAPVLMPTPIRAQLEVESSNLWLQDIHGGINMNQQVGILKNLEKPGSQNYKAPFSSGWGFITPFVGKTCLTKKNLVALGVSPGKGQLASLNHIIIYPWIIPKKKCLFHASFRILFLGGEGSFVGKFFLCGGGRLWSTGFDVDIPDFSDSGVKEMKQTSIIGYRLSPVTLPYLFTQSLCKHTWQHNTASFNLISIIHVETLRFKFRKVL